MQKNVSGNLNPRMRERLEKWKERHLNSKTLHIPKRNSTRSFVPRRGKQFDDFTDLENQAAIIETYSNFRRSL